MMAQFLSKYAGHCKICGGKIEIGELINWTKDTGASHVKCPTKIQSPQKIESNKTPHPVLPEPVFVVPTELKNVVIKPFYYDGEYLSGYMVSDKDGTLEKLGLCHYVSGWGTHLDDDNILKIYGESFTFAQAEEYTKPKREAIAKLKAEKINAQNNKKFDAFVEAKQTNKPIILKTWNEECNDPTEECNIDSLTQYAMPDGSTKITRSHNW